MKMLFLFLLFFSIVISSFAEVKIGDYPPFSKKENKDVRVALKRVVNFYTWYLNYIHVNKTRPTQHLVIDQNATAHMREEAFTNIHNYDVFLANTQVDATCDLEIIPKKIKNGRINLQVNVSGKYKYVFHIDMIVQKGNWCIDLVVADEDLNPQINEKE